MTKSNLTVRIDGELKDKYEELAESEHRSLNKQVEKALEEYLETKESLGYIFVPDLEEAERSIDEGEVEPVWKGE